MKNPIKILCSVVLFAVIILFGAWYYNQFTDKQTIQAQQRRIDALTRKVDELSPSSIAPVVTTPSLVKIETASTTKQSAIEVKPSLKNTIVPKPDKAPSQAISQINAFDDYLEYGLVGAQVDCVVLATYNNYNNQFLAGSMSPQSFQQAFPESGEEYERKCTKSYLDVVTGQRSLIAEPELQPLRILLTSYAEASKTFAQYALGGGALSSEINDADKRMDTLRTLAREEVIRLKRKYNLN